MPRVALRDGAGEPCGRPPRHDDRVGRRRRRTGRTAARPRWAGSTRPCSPGSHARASRARLASPARRARQSAAAARRPPHGRDPPGELGEVAEDRRDVPVGEQHHRHRDPRRREAVRPHRPARPERRAEREDGRDDERPADQVVEERRPGEQPAVLLVDEERHAGDEERRGRDERPVRRREPPRTTASCTAPAAVAACAQSECATRWSVENVEKIVITQSQSPRRARETARGTHARTAAGRRPGPTIASASTTRPKKRKPAANSQCAVSARGSISALAPGRSRSSTTPARRGGRTGGRPGTTRSGGWTSQSQNPFPPGRRT